MDQEKKCQLFIGSKWFPVIFWILFGLVFMIAASDSDIRLVDVTNETIASLFTKYSLYAGFVFGFLSLLIGYILRLIANITKLNRFRIVYPIIAILIILPWYLFARQLVYHENQFTDLSRAIIYFIGEPLLTASVNIFWLLIILSAIQAIKKIISVKFLKKTAQIGIILLCPMFLGGCLGDIESIVCGLLEDSDHCFQNAAIQEGENEECEKIKGEGFVGSNPPRDKCYLLIAENTGDLNACDHIEGGMMSYTKEECILGASIKFADASGCKKLTGADYSACVAAVGPKVDPYKMLEIDNQIKQLEDELKNSPDANLENQLKGLKTMRQDMLDVATTGVKAEYTEISDPTYQQISGDYATGAIDRETKNQLVELNKSLKAQGANLSDEQYKQVRDYLAFKNDPDNDVENMDPKDILGKRWNEKLGSAVDYLKFWNSNPTQAEKNYDEQLLFYSRMLERQEAILKNQSEYEQDIDRNINIVAGGGANYAGDKAKEALFKYLFGEATEKSANVVTAVLGEALDTVKAEAKSAEFRGLVRAYNLGMQDELAAAGGDVEKAHATVIKKMQTNPYEYEDSHTFAQYGNILENKDCDGSNPHCINRDVFWKAMKKSYTFQHQTK